MSALPGYFRRQSAPPAPARRECRKFAIDAFAAGPVSFHELMASLGTRDGRDVVRELDKLYALDRSARRDDGRYILKPDARDP